jgi:hypothetical protein
MATTGDCKFNALRGLGYTGAMPEMTLEWLQDVGATSPALPDAWREFLDLEGFTSGNRNDDWWGFLDKDAPVEIGRTLPDLEHWFWCVSMGGCTAPTINTQPLPDSSTVGGSATFTVVATACSGVLTYMWQVFQEGGSWVDLAPDDATTIGTTTDTLTLLSLTAPNDGLLFRVIVMDDAGSVNSNSALLTVA